MLIGFGGLCAFGFRFAYGALALILIFYTNTMHCVVGIRSGVDLLVSFRGWAIECALIGFCLAMFCEEKKKNRFPGKGIVLGESDENASVKQRPGAQSIPR